MFTILGGDGKEYGPVTTEQVRGWITAGRANLDTKARAVGSEEWRRLGDFAEFGGAAGVPPLMGGLPPAMGSLPSSVRTFHQTPPADYAGRGARTGAALFNAFFYFISLMPGSIMLGLQVVKQNPSLGSGGIAQPSDLDLTGINTSWPAIGLWLAVLVQLIVIALRGQNLGKLILGIRVVRADNGQPAGFLRAGLLRFLLPVSLFFLPHRLGFLGFLFLLVDFCFIFGEERRCLHDLIAGTKVVKNRP